MWQQYIWFEIMKRAESIANEWDTPEANQEKFSITRGIKPPKNHLSHSVFKGMISKEPAVLICTGTTFDPSLAQIHLGMYVIWHQISQTERRVSSCGYSLTSVPCPLWVGSRPPLAAAPSISVSVEIEDSTERGRSKQLPYSGLSRW